MTTRFTIDTSDELGDGLRQYAADSGLPIAEIGRRALARVVSEPAPYRFSGREGPCLVRDLAAAEGWYVANTDRAEAVERLKRFASWSDDLHDRARFATVTTATVPQVVSTAQRVVTALQWTSERPLVDAASRGGDLSDATPFTVPVLEGFTDTGAAGFDSVDEARTEGNNPADGTLVPRRRTVTPVIRTGRMVLTRELIDAAVPAGDSIALAAAVEDYNRSVEALAYANLNAAQSGTITTGFVPNGAQARTSTGAALPTDLKVALAEYAMRRLARARNVVVGGTTAHVQLAPALDDATGDDTCVARIQGARVNWATTTFGGAAGDMDVAILGRDDFWVWESPLLRFRYEEVGGPATVSVGVWGYVAAEVIRPRGLSSIRHT